MDRHQVTWSAIYDLHEHILVPVLSCASLAAMRGTGETMSTMVG